MADATPFAIQTRSLNLYYGDFQALFDIDLQIRAGIITSMIGPSGCGKSTFLRSVNRINERLGYVRTTGSVEVMGHDIYDEGVELVQVRKQVGMVFQRPNPLPLSIRDNVLFGHRIHERARKPNRTQREEILEEALSQVLLWDSVKDRLELKATELSLEEQQKLFDAVLIPAQKRYHEALEDAQEAYQKVANPDRPYRRRTFTGPLQTKPEFKE